MYVLNGSILIHGRVRFHACIERFNLNTWPRSFSCMFWTVPILKSGMFWTVWSHTYNYSRLYTRHIMPAPYHIPDIVHLPHKFEDDTQMISKSERIDHMNHVVLAVRVLRFQHVKYFQFDERLMVESGNVGTNKKMKKYLHGSFVEIRSRHPMKCKLGILCTSACAPYYNTTSAIKQQPINTEAPVPRSQVVKAHMYTNLWKQRIYE